MCINKCWKPTGSFIDMKHIHCEKFHPFDTVLFLCLEQKCEVKADDLEQICELGRGAYGVVDKMRHVPSDLIMAVKVSKSKPIVTQKIRCSLLLLVSLNTYYCQTSTLNISVCLLNSLFIIGQLSIITVVENSELWLWHASQYLIKSYRNVLVLIGLCRAAMSRHNQKTVVSMSVWRTVEKFSCEWNQ